MNELLEKAVNRDNNAITEIFLNMQKQLYAISRARLQNEDDINDAIQETMLNVYKNIDKVKHTEYLKTWIIRILINNCNLIYRKKILYNKLYELSNIENNLFGKDDEISFVDKKLDFFILIKDLNYQERQLITLYYYNKYTTKQISEILDLNENTIRTKILRAKDKLRKKYKEFDD